MNKGIEEQVKAAKEIVSMFREPMIVALKTAVLENVETGFQINTSNDGKYMMVDGIEKGDKLQVRIGEVKNPPFKEEDFDAIDTSGQLMQTILEAVQDIRKANLNYVGDFHVHLSPKLPLNVVDMFHTMARGGLLSILANVINRKRAKITYYVWNQDDPHYSEHMVAAGIMLVLLNTPNLERIARQIEQKAEKIGREILNSKAVSFTDTFKLRIG